MMFPQKTDRSLRIVGVALEGREGSPVVVLESPGTGLFLPLAVDPFEAEIIIREFLETPDTAVAWLAQAIQSSPPRRGRIEMDSEGSPRMHLLYGLASSERDRYLSVGEGMILCRRLGIPVSAPESLFETSRDELSWLSSTGTFTGDFLYLSPPQYAPGIPVE